MSKFPIALILSGLIGGLLLLNGGDSPGPSPQSDSLAEVYKADRVTQVTVLRELAGQSFDGSTDEGRRLAGEWFNAQRFRNRADDFAKFTDEVAEAIAANSEAELADRLGGR